MMADIPLVLFYYIWLVIGTGLAIAIIVAFVGIADAFKRESARIDEMIADALKNID